MRFASLCSGIEAASVAWNSLGWRAAFFAEIDRFPSAVLADRHPGVPNLGDMTRFKEWPDAVFDVLVGGTPCQSFSVAGLRGGLADPRGNLALVYLAIADRYRPRWCVWENVPGVLSSNEGRDFGAFLGGMGELGYGFAYRVLDAQYFGVPQRRRRVFVVGHLGDWRAAASVLLEPESLRGDPAPRRKAREGLARPIAAGSQRGSGYRNDADTAENLIAGTLQAAGKAAGSATQQDAESGLLVAYGIDSDCFDRSGEGAVGTAAARSGLGIQRELSSALRSKRPNAVAFGGNDTRGAIDVATAVNAHGGPHGRLDFESETFVFDTTQITHPENRSRPKSGGPSPTLAKGGHAPAIAFNSREELCFGDVAGALGSSSPQAAAAQIASTVRRLTPRECERLQGFPDDYTLIDWRGKPAADGPRYKALGNSMAVPVMAWIGRRIAAVDAALRMQEAA